MAQHLCVDLSSLNTAVSLWSVPQSMQGVHRIIQSWPLFDVVSGCVKQLPCPEYNCFLCLCHALGKSGFIHFKERSLVHLSADNSIP